MGLIAVMLDKNNHSVMMQTDLKTEKGYINRVINGKYEMKRVVEIEFFKTSSNNPRPYYNPSKKPDKIVKIRRD